MDRGKNESYNIIINGNRGLFVRVELSGGKRTSKPRTRKKRDYSSTRKCIAIA